MFDPLTWNISIPMDKTHVDNTYMNKEKKNKNLEDPLLWK